MHRQTRSRRGGGAESHHAAPRCAGTGHAGHGRAPRCGQPQGARAGALRRGLCHECRKRVAGRPDRERTQERAGDTRHRVGPARDPCLPGTFFGLRAHRRVTWPGVIAGLEQAPANGADLALAPELLAGARGWALGDRAYWSPDLRERLRARGVRLLAPFQTRKYERTPWPRWLVTTRRRIETVLAQLVERYRAKRTWARDLWHLCSRWLRKVLSHTTAVLLCQQHGLGSLAFSQLVAA